MTKNGRDHQHGIHLLCLIVCRLCLCSFRIFGRDSVATTILGSTTAATTNQTNKEWGRVVDLMIRYMLCFYSSICLHVSQQMLLHWNGHHRKPKTQNTHQERYKDNNPTQQNRWLPPIYRSNALKDASGQSWPFLTSIVSNMYCWVWPPPTSFSA
jgi:hypothetical protein